MGKKLSKQQVAIPHNMDDSVPELPTKERNESEETLEDSLDVESLIGRMSVSTTISSSESDSKLMLLLKNHEDNLLTCSAVIADTQRSNLCANVYIFKLSFFDSSYQLKYFVHRIFDNFTLLDSALKNRFRGLLIPTLNKTGLKVTGTESENLATLLEFYMNFLLRNPFICADKIFQEFTQSQEMFTEKRLEIVSTEKSLGLQSWRVFISIMKTPKEPKKLKREIRSELNLLISQYKSLKAEFSTYLASLESERKHESELNETFGTWVQLETTKLPQLLGSVFYSNTLNSETKTRLNVFSVIEDTKSIISQEEEALEIKTQALAKLIYGDLEFQIQLFHDFIDTLVFVKNAIHEYKVKNQNFKACEEKYQKTVKKLKAKFESRAAEIDQKVRHVQKYGDLSLASGDFTEHSELQPVKENLEKAKEERSFAVKEYNEILRAILVIEFSRLKHERSVNLIKILRLFSETKFLSGEKVDKEFKNFYEKMPKSGKIKPMSDILLLDVIHGEKIDETEKIEIFNLPTIIEVPKLEENINAQKQEADTGLFEKDKTPQASENVPSNSGENSYSPRDPEDKTTLEEKVMPEDKGQTEREKQKENEEEKEMIRDEEKEEEKKEMIRDEEKVPEEEKAKDEEKVANEEEEEPKKRFWWFRKPFIKA